MAGPLHGYMFATLYEARSNDGGRQARFLSKSGNDNWQMSCGVKRYFYRRLAK